ncbi:DC1 domain-containing protein [Corchorus olitorius]|uniref:DC1 domain-containing protein n=1 Tax=Corchorus olitorius TaxID=93759 RepID=A0A1R3JDT9_9ROSI|nr:DC1 domain-containing protein [Corchorus olitorius]
MAQSKLEGLEGVQLQAYPFIHSTETDPKEVLDSFSFESDIIKKCVDLPPKINHICHRKHPLLLQFLTLESLSCKIKRWAYCCKKCNFALGPECLTLPIRVQHKCDEKHHLALTYSDDNDYSATHYCDICEERRDPNHWFYHCATCDTSAHVKCALGDFPFIKVGSIHEFDDGTAGTFVKKIYYYPKCDKCDEPCQDLALELEESGLSYYIHVKCSLEFLLP